MIESQTPLLRQELLNNICPEQRRIVLADYFYAKTYKAEILASDHSIFIITHPPHRCARRILDN
jgi:hypothetical protein